MSRVTTTDLHFHLLEGESLLDGLERTGHDVEYQCRSGYCGVCRLTLLSGAVSYDRWPMSASRRFCLAAARSLSRYTWNVAYRGRPSFRLNWNSASLISDGIAIGQPEGRHQPAERVCLLAHDF